MMTGERAAAYGMAWLSNGFLWVSGRSRSFLCTKRSWGLLGRSTKIWYAKHMERLVIWVMGFGVSFRDVEWLETMECSTVPIIIDSIQLLLTIATENHLLRGICERLLNYGW